jgi:hypothetical protein
MAASYMCKDEEMHIALKGFRRRDFSNFENPLKLLILEKYNKSIPNGGNIHECKFLRVFNLGKKPK